MSKFCNYCGTEVDKSHLFCDEYGIKLELSEDYILNQVKEYFDKKVKELMTSKEICPNCNQRTISCIIFSGRDWERNNKTENWRMYCWYCHGWYDVPKEFQCEKGTEVKPRQPIELRLLKRIKDILKFK